MGVFITSLKVIGSLLCLGAIIGGIGIIVASSPGFSTPGGSGFYFLFALIGVTIGGR
jgi:hypothetical protein